MDRTRERQMTQISIRKLRRSYDGREVLKGVDLDIESGQFVSIVGRSGCGKSTLLNCIADFIPSTSGEVTGREEFGFVFQNHSLYPFMTCGGNIALGLGHLQPAERRKKVEQYLEIVGLPGYGGRYPWQLSGGESQRIAIARAFAPEPGVVLMDEPLSALDVMRREAMMDWLMEFLDKRPTTILMVTHWIDEAIMPADRVIVLGDGSVIDDVAVNLPRPRNSQTKNAAEFAALRTRIRNCIFLA